MEYADWRLIETPLAEGSWNMALDEALLESVGAGKSLPILRLYGWQPPCLSIGYAQMFSDIDEVALHSQQWSFVRRPTGGRAVLHIDELTYSVMAPLTEPRVEGSIIESYRRLSQALLKALSILGVNAQADHEYALPLGAQKNGVVCFEVPSNYEITVNNQKLIGSAQARKHHGVLQHGSLPLQGDIARILSVLAFNDDEKKELAEKRLRSHATTMEEVTGSIIPWSDASKAFDQAFSSTLKINFTPSQASPGEVKRARQLQAEKYANLTWLQRI